MIKYFLNVGQPGKDRAYLFSALSDKSMPVRIAAAQVIKDLVLDEEELQKIAGLLALKTGGIRQAALDIIKNQNSKKIRHSIDLLIRDESESKRLGALDILNHLLDREEIDKPQVAVCLALMPKVTEHERILVDELKRVDVKQYTQANGFGLYDVQYRPDLPPLEIVPAYTLETFREESADKCIQAVQSLIEVIRRNKDYTYTIKMWDASEIEVIFGNQSGILAGAWRAWQWITIFLC